MSVGTRSGGEVGLASLIAGRGKRGGVLAESGKVGRGPLKNSGNRRVLLLALVGLGHAAWRSRG